ncbi:MAG: imidazolonepropionase [Acholeplasmataceae bacterium]
MIADLIIHHIKSIYTPNQKAPIKGLNMRNIQVIENGYVAIKDGVILSVGNGLYEHLIGSNTKTLDAENKIMLPAFIDSHTHLVHGGSREDEYGEIIQGIPYLDILKAGGGIHHTVNHTISATFDELYNKAYQSLDLMLKSGVSVVEAKSGYGLELKTEIKQLEVAKKLNAHHPIELHSTYMGAHAIPKRYEQHKDRYINEVISDLTIIKENDLASAVDIFCEAHVFSVEDSRKILTQAKKLGFKIKMHADEIQSLGGTSLAVNLGCSSVDHLMVINDEDIKKLSTSSTIANLLPGTSFYLNKAFAPGRKMIDQGVAVSISTDYNPGSCPTENLLLVMQIAANKMKLLPEEVLTAVTLNAAYHLGISETHGSIEVGKQANVILVNAPNLNYVFYHYGINHVSDVWIKGQQVLKNQEIVRNVR